MDGYKGAENGGMDLAAELQKIYDSEINGEISWFWDAGFQVRLGDRVNGYIAASTVQLLADIAPCLHLAIADFYPTSTYAASLDGEVKERAVREIFRPPRSGARLTCPHCGASHANAAGLEEALSFVCSHCGLGVSVERPAVQ